MRGWLHVFRKELREFARDKRILYSALLGPVLLEIFIITLFGYIKEAFSEERTHKISVVNPEAGAPVMEILEKTHKFEITVLTNATKADELLRKQKTKLVLQFPSDFKSKYEAQQAPEFYAIFDPNEETSQFALGVVREVVEKAKEVEREIRIRDLALNPDRLEAYRLHEEPADTGKPFAGTWLVGFLPYLIVIWAFYGGFSIVSDLVAGEKERGSLETLLVSPVSRTAIAFGKFAALAALSFTSCVSALMGVVIMGVLNLPLTRDLFEGGLSISALSVFAIAATLVPLVVFFAGMLLSVSTFARNQREVQGYLSLLSFLVLIPAIMSQFIGYTEAATAKWLPFVPVLNTASVIRQALLEKVDWYNLGTTAAINSALAAIGLLLAIRLFSKESVLLRT